MLSAFDCSCGSTSPTVRSTSTPLIMRKHLREVGRGVRVSRTSLEERISKNGVAFVLSGVASCAERKVTAILRVGGLASRAMAAMKSSEH